MFKTDKEVSSETRRQMHKNPIHSHFYDSILDTYGHHRHVDVDSTTGISRQICSSCGRNPECLTLKAPEDASIADALYWLCRVMLVFGLMPVKKKDTWLTKSVLYSVLIILLLWANFIWFFYAYTDTWTFGSQLFYRITMHIWFGQCALINTVFVFQVAPAFPGFLKKWNSFAYNHHCQTAEQARRNSLRAMLVGFTFSITSMAIVLAMTLVTSWHRAAVDHYLDDILGLEDTPLPLKFTIIALQALLNFLWMLPIAFLHAISATLHWNFTRITGLLRAVLREPDTVQMGEAIEKLRNRHQQLCRVVKDLDSIYSVCMLAVYITCIPVVCLATYNLAFNVYDGMSIVVVEAAIMFVCIILQMGTVTSSVSSITAAANSPTEELFDFQIKGHSPDLHRRAFQVSIFIQRITHCHIGLTAWNLFNVNKQTVFMLTTMILSYVFVLFKLGLSLEKKDTYVHGANVTHH